MQSFIEIMAVNKKGTSSKTKTDEDEIRLDVDVWDVSIIDINNFACIHSFTNSSIITFTKTSSTTLQCKVCMLKGY